MLLGAIRLALRLFYRRIHYVGRDRVSPSGPTLFVLNHPNALVDPLFVFDAVRRPVHFLAKAPLLRMPVLGRVIAWLGALPVYRSVDGADTSRNLQTFRECHDVLARGECIAIFPEGTTHSGTTLRPAKTGAARIALGAEAVAAFTLGLEVVPVGLQYEAKQTFRSDVTVWFGPPHRVAYLKDLYDEHPSAAVHEETRRLEAALLRVTLNADKQDTLDLIAVATGIFAEKREADEAELVRLRQQFSEGYEWLLQRAPERIGRLRRAVGRHLFMLQRLGVRQSDLNAGRWPPAGNLAWRSVTMVPLLALAALGVALDWVPYRLVHAIATRSTRGELEMTATIKLIAAIVLYPLWWIVTSLAVGWTIGRPFGLLLLGLHPLVAYLAMNAVDRLRDSAHSLRLFRLASNRQRFARLRRHEHVIRKELQALARLYVEGPE